MKKNSLFQLIILIALVSCSSPLSSQRNPTPTQVPPLILTQTADANFQQMQNHNGAIRFMSWNIQNGGVAFDDNGPDNLEEGRVPLIIEVINRSNPDVVLLQETNGWDLGNPAIVQQIAISINMEYYVYCDSPGEPNEDYGSGSASLDNVIFSKFPISEFESYEGRVYWCALYAKINLPGGQNVNVFSTHIIANTFVRCNENQIGLLSEYSRGKTSEYGVLMGDFNILDGIVEGQVPREVCYNLLADAGWNIIHEETVDIIFLSQEIIDQSLTYEALSNMDNPLFDPLIEHKKGVVASDHEPVIVDVFFP